MTAKLDLDGYREAAYRQALSEVDHLPDESPVDHRMREIFYLNLTRFVQILLDRKDRMSMAVGLEVRVPFCDHRLVDYVFNIPWHLKTFDGREKSILRAAASVTEAYMRPLYHKKADRLRAKAEKLEKEGPAKLAALKQRSEAEYQLFRKAFAHIVMGLGGESDEDTAQRIEKHGPISDEQIIKGLVAVLRQDAFNHRDLQAIDGRHANGMSVMFMGASTGCNTVYGSTPPSNPRAGTRWRHRGCETPRSGRRGR